MPTGRRISALAAAAIAAAAPAAAQSPADAAEALRGAQRLALQYGLVALRTTVDLTYDSLTVDARTGDTVINGLEFYPDIDWMAETPCTVSVDRVAVSGAPADAGLETLVQVSGVSVPRVCIEPAAAAMLQGFGYDGIEIAGASLRLAYDIPSAGADLEINAAVEDAGEVNLVARFDYLSLRSGGLEEFEAEGAPELEPVAHLRSAELSFDNRGVWERVEPLIASQVEGDLSELPRALPQLVGPMLSAPGQPPTPEVEARSEEASCRERV